MNPADLLPMRIASQIEVEPDGGCWIWGGALSDRGYGKVSWKGASVYAHRVTLHAMDPAVEVEPGPGADHVDHLCGVRRCCNPLHLEQTTCAENLRRGREVRKPSAA